jgi:hypothetical protein
MAQLLPPGLCFALHFALLPALLLACLGFLEQSDGLGAQYVGLAHALLGFIGLILHLSLPVSFLCSAVVRVTT